MWKTVSELVTHALGALPDEGPESGTGEGNWQSRATRSAGEQAEQPLDQSRHIQSYRSTSLDVQSGSNDIGRPPSLAQGFTGSFFGAREADEAVLERQRLKKLRGFYELSKECLKRGLDADERGDTAKAGQLYRKFLEIVQEALLVPVGSKSTEAQKIVKELTKFTDTVNGRLQDLSKSRSTARSASQKSTKSSTPLPFTASAWESSQQQKKQDAGISLYTGWLGFGASKPTTDAVTSNTTVFPPHHQGAGQQPANGQQRASSQPTVPGPRTSTVAARRATGVPPASAGVSNPSTRSRHAGGAPGAEEGEHRREGSGCVDPKLVEMIESEIVDRRPIVQWDDIAGLQKAKQALQEMVILPTLRQDLFQGIRKPARGLLLFGPPGNGKTMLARAVASQAKATFFNVSAASLTSKWMGEGEKLVRALFSLAAERQPSVIFIDEIDSILSERSQGEHEASRRLKTEFLVQFDGVLGNDREHVVVMGATNRPEELDEAARRRLVKRIYIPLPDAPARAALLRSLTSTKHTFSVSERDLGHIVELTDGYSGSDLKALCQEAAMAPIRDLGARVASVRACDVRKVTLSDLMNAMKVIKPSVDGASLRHFEDWARKFGSTS